MSTLFFTTATKAFHNYPRGKIPELDSDIQLLDIHQLVVHCRKKLALTSTTNGFAWFRLEAVIATAPEIWDNYVAWYFSEFDVNPLSLLESDAPSPPRTVPSQVISDRIDSLDSNHRLPSSPYGSTDITTIYSVAILTGNLQALRYDWLTFLDVSECVKSHQKLKLKVSMHRYWLRFKSIISFQKLQSACSSSQPVLLAKLDYRVYFDTLNSISNSSVVGSICFVCSRAFWSASSPIIIYADFDSTNNCDSSSVLMEDSS